MSDTTEETKAVAIVGPSNNSLLQAVMDAARDPTVSPEKMMGLIDVNERLMKRQAELDFTAAFGRLQKKLANVVIKKGGSITVDGRERSKYAKYEDIMAVVRPLMIEEGFTLRFSSSTEGGKMSVRGTLSHEGGHSVETVTPMVTDANPKVMNSQQAIGSASSYAQRYVVKLLLNLVFEGEDDDGRKAGATVLTPEQAAEIKDLIRETGTDTQKFLALMASGASCVDEIDGRDYNRIINALLTKKERA